MLFDKPTETCVFTVHSHVSNAGAIRTFYAIGHPRDSRSLTNLGTADGIDGNPHAVALGPDYSLVAVGALSVDSSQCEGFEPLKVVLAVSTSLFELDSTDRGGMFHGTLTLSPRTSSVLPNVVVGPAPPPMSPAPAASADSERDNSAPTEEGAVEQSSVDTSGESVLDPSVAQNLASDTLAAGSPASDELTSERATSVKRPAVTARGLLARDLVWSGAKPTGAAALAAQGAPRAQVGLGGLAVFPKPGAATGDTGRQEKASARQQLGVDLEKARRKHAGSLASTSALVKRLTATLANEIQKARTELGLATVCVQSIEGRLWSAGKEQSLAKAQLRVESAQQRLAVLTGSVPETPPSLRSALQQAVEKLTMLERNVPGGNPSLSILDDRVCEPNQKVLVS